MNIDIRSPELTGAIQSVRIAENRLDEADTKEEIDAACYEITAARLRLNAVIKQAKMEVGA